MTHSCNHSCCAPTWEIEHSKTAKQFENDAVAICRSFSCALADGANQMPSTNINVCAELFSEDSDAAKPTSADRSPAVGRVLGMCAEAQIRAPIVEAVAVDVVNHLTRQRRHYQAMHHYGLFAGVRISIAASMRGRFFACAEPPAVDAQHGDAIVINDGDRALAEGYLSHVTPTLSEWLLAGRALLRQSMRPYDLSNSWSLASAVAEQGPLRAFAYPRRRENSEFQIALPDAMKGPGRNLYCVPSGSVSAAEGFGTAGIPTREGSRHG